MTEERKSIWVESVNIVPQEPTYLVDGIPDDNITLLVGDGGVGKGMLTCHLTAAVTTGTATIFEDEAVTREPDRVLLLNAEDSYSRQTTNRLTRAGADHALITTFDASVRVPDIPEIIDGMYQYQPRLTIIDPLQAFIPQGAAMERRNVMRKIMSPLQAAAADLKCAVLVVMHTNKRIGAYGRNRCSDSSDLWDIARSVFIMGDTCDEWHTRYISHEKNSYGEPNRTQLCCIGSRGLYKTGDTDKKDRDFILERDRQAGGRPAVKRKEAEEILLEAIRANGGKMTNKELDNVADQNDITGATLRRARSNLLDTGALERESIGKGKFYQVIYKTCT